MRLDRSRRFSQNIGPLLQKQEKTGCERIAAEIARLLGITVIAVKKHFEVIYAKIGASNRSEAIAIALRNNLLKNRL